MSARPVMTRTRMRTRVQGFEPTWNEPAPEARAFPAVELAFGLALLLSVLWWATAAELLVGSGWREGGRVLSCKYLAGTRVVERQYLAAADGPGQSACSLVRFG